MEGTMKRLIIVLNFLMLGSYNTFGAAAAIDTKPIEQAMMLAVATRSVEQFLVKADELRTLGKTPADYRTSAGRNLIHVLMTTTPKADDPRAKELLTLLLYEGISPLEKESSGRESPLDVAFKRFKDESHIYIGEMMKFLPQKVNDDFYRSSPPPLRQVLEKTDLHKPERFIPKAIRAGRATPSPLGTGFTLASSVPDTLSFDFNQDAALLLELLKNHRTGRVLELFRNTHQINPAYLGALLTTPTVQNDTTFTLFCKLVYHNQKEIINWILNEAGLNSLQKKTLLSSPVIASDGTQMPLLLLPLTAGKTEVAKMLLKDLNLSYLQILRLLEAPTIYQNGVQASLLYMLLAQKRYDSASWLLHDTGLAEPDVERFYSQKILLNDGSQQTLLAHLLNSNEFEAAGWLLKEAALSEDIIKFLLHQRVIDPDGNKESLLFDLLINENTYAVKWLFTQAGLSAESINELLEDSASDDGETLRSHLEYHNAEDALTFLMSDDSGLTHDQRRLIFGDEFDAALEESQADGIDDGAAAAE